MKMILTLAVLGSTMFAMVAPANAQVNRRQDMQQHRIDRGVRSGELTRSEAYRLQHQQNRIARTEERMRYSGGGLSNRERNRLSNLQNRAGANIRRQKNDRQDRW